MMNVESKMNCVKFKSSKTIIIRLFYKVIRRFGKGKLTHDGLILSSSQFLLLPRLPQKTKPVKKVGKKEQEKSPHYRDLNP